MIKVNKWFPSSKLCSNCNNIYSDLKLDERTWTCIIWHCEHNRDINAAINIKEEGLRILGVIDNKSNRWANGVSLVIMPTLVGTSQEAPT
ncbi:MAG: transposase [Clostridiales bacterium]|nr:transposase [Clostridiales bacterium]